MKINRFNKQKQAFLIPKWSDKDSKDTVDKTWKKGVHDCRGDKKVSAEIVATPGGTRTKKCEWGGRRMTKKEKGIRWEKGMGLGESGGRGRERDSLYRG